MSRESPMSETTQSTDALSLSTQDMQRLHEQAARSRARAFRANLSAYGFMAPAAILVVMFFLIPVGIVIYLSMTDLASANFTSNLAKMHFVGAKNFETLFNDQFVRKIF